MLQIKHFDTLQSKDQSIVLKEIQENISKTLVPTLDSYGLKLCLMTLKSRDSQHIIDFENENTRRNIGNFELSKFVSLNKMNDSQKDEVEQSLLGIQKNFISKMAYQRLSTYNPSLISYNNIQRLKKRIRF